MKCFIILLKALDSAVKEINHISDISVEYIISRSGYGGRVDHVEFEKINEKTNFILSYKINFRN